MSMKMMKLDRKKVSDVMDVIEEDDGFLISSVLFSSTSSFFSSHVLCSILTAALSVTPSEVTARTVISTNLFVICSVSSTLFLLT